MGTLTSMRQTNTGMRRRERVSLPSLKNNGARWSPLDPALSSGSLTEGSRYVPLPPKQRLGPSEVPSHKLSHSAPSILEPLLSANTVIQARALTRLGSREATNERKSPRTPKLLEPLGGRLQGSAALPVLKHRLPLKPISPRPRFPKYGSEESGSSSSSSVDMEEERTFVFIQDGFPKHQKEDTGCFIVKSDIFTQNITQSHADILVKKPFTSRSMMSDVGYTYKAHGSSTEQATKTDFFDVSSSSASDSHTDLIHGCEDLKSNLSFASEGNISDNRDVSGALTLKMDEAHVEAHKPAETTGRAKNCKSNNQACRTVRTSEVKVHSNAFVKSQVKCCQSKVLSTVQHDVTQASNTVNNKVPDGPSEVELQTNQQIKTPCVAATSRPIPKEGPAIYGMFAGPFREEQDTWYLDQSQLRHNLLKQTQIKPSKGRVEDGIVSSKSKAKPAPPRVKPRPTCSTRKPKSNKGTSPQLEDVVSEHGQNIGQDVSNGVRFITVCDSKTMTLEDKTFNVSPTLRNVPETKVKTQSGNQEKPVPEPLLAQPETSQSDTSDPPVYERFLNESGDGPLTDDLLKCLAEELISLDETHLSWSPGNHFLRDTMSSKSDSTKSTVSAERFPNPPLNDAMTWTKGEVLGRGAYGTVHCGLTSDGQLIAVKQVSLDTADPDSSELEYSCLQEEVELLKTLKHDNIVGFLGTTLKKEVVSIFMEYIPGGSIASILQRFGPLPEQVLALYTHQILEGVVYLHRNRVIHRDLKGKNVMLMPTGVIKLIDFGCARRLSCLNNGAGDSCDLLRSVHGTPYWMAPEVINETGYGRKSDIWSVGCTVFEMATGKPPLAHMDKIAALFYIGAKKGSMPALPGRFSTHAKDFVQICLTSDPTLRPSAVQLLNHSFVSKNQSRSDGVLIVRHASTK